MCMTLRLLYIFAALIVAVLGYAGYLYARVAQATSISEGLIRDAVPYEQHPSNATKHFLVFGDSTAVGVGSVPNASSTAGRLGNDFRNADVENVSKSGLKLAGLEAKIPLVSRDHYDLILIQIGANDITGLTSLSAVQASLTHVLSWASSHSEKVIIFSAGNVGLAPVFGWPLRELYSHRTLEVRDIFMKTAASYPNVSYVDLYRDAAHDQFIKDIPKYYAPDHFHPSSDGYAIWYEGVREYLPKN
jgi:lysophospholipase L1-like esterase